MPWSSCVLARYVPASHWCKFTKPDKEMRNKRLSRKHQPVPGRARAEAPAQPDPAHHQAARNLHRHPNPPDILAQLCSPTSPGPRGPHPAGTRLLSGGGSWQGSARSLACHSLQTISIYCPKRESHLRRRLPRRTRHSPHSGHRPPPRPWPDDLTSSSRCRRLPHLSLLLPTFSFFFLLSPLGVPPPPHAQRDTASSNPPAHIPSPRSMKD